MKIKELIIDGFKSYQKQVILTEFDPQFNALTGQNGSGKSNILEAIFFGIGSSFRNQKLSRLNSARDFIYQRGQSSIQKAKVIIKFCNRDKAKSPVGYENYDELVLERSINSIDNKSKFKLNSVTKSSSQIKAIFKSIRLNVNNSNTFYVQQGRVAEIVKFHSLELMKFIEETAGVSYFNSVKNDTIKDINNNEPKLQSCIETLDEIEKKQGNLKEEREIYKQYKLLEQQLHKLYATKEFYERKLGREDLIRNEKEIKILQEKENQITNTIKQNEILLKNKIEEIQKFVREEKNPSSQNIDNKQQQEYQNKLKTINLNIDNIEVHLDNLKSQQQRLKVENNNKQSLKEEKRVLLDSLQQQYQNLQREQQKNKLDKKEIEVYISKDNNQQSSEDFLKQKFEQSKQDHLNIQKKLENEKNKLDALNSNLKEFQDQLAIKNSKYENLIQKQQKTLQFQKELDLQYDKIRKNKKQIEQIQDQKNYLKKQKNEIEDKMQREIGGIIHSLDIQNFQKINEIFDKNLFFQKVHNIINVKDPDRFNTALETIAGTKLFNYVVRDKEVMVNLMDSKLLSGDIKIIPNNQIRGSCVSIEKLTLAKELAKKIGQQVWIAQELIQYPKELEKTINYVFQSVVICSNKEIAKKICFQDKRLRLPCVTLMGDTYDPSGMLSGGYSVNRISFFEKSQQFKVLQEQKFSLLQQIKQNKDKENSLQNIYHQEKKIKEQIFQNTKKQNEIQNKIDNLKLEHLKNQIETTQTQIKFSNNFLNDYDKKQQENKKIKDEYKQQLNSRKSKSKTNFFNQRLIDINKQLEQSELQIQQTQQKIKETEKFLQNLKSTKTDFQDQQNDLLQKINLKNKELSEQQKEKKQLQKQIDEHMQELYQHQSHLNFLQQKENALNQQQQDIENQLEELKIQLIQQKEDILEKKENQYQLEQLFKGRNKNKFNQIQMEIEDNEEQSREIIIQKLQDIKKQINSNLKNLDILKKKVNPDSEEAFNKGDRLLNLHTQQKNEVLRNKDCLLTSIDKLTYRSYETIEKCFVKVNENLGNIFSTLLPGTTAKMEMIDVFNKKKNANEKGIQIKVKIGSKWKKSLGELSGGQRTLLALAFLLSLLKYNSAPFYIFDEVDAALDQSHTENLGLIISKYFSEKLLKQEDFQQWKEQI